MVLTVNLCHWSVSISPKETRGMKWVKKVVALIEWKLKPYFCYRKYFVFCNNF